MSNKLRTGLITGYIVFMILVAIGIWVYMNRMVYNPEGARGNTAGNLNNNGMFCEYDGTIYFANPYDKNRLYAMNSDCTNIRKLNSDTVCSINVYGKYIYYVRNNYSPETAALIFRGQLLGVIRTNLKGTHPKALYDSVAGVINLYGNELYYQHYSNTEGLSFYKVGIDGKNNIQVNQKGTYPSSIYNDVLYYTNTDGDHGIYTHDLKTGVDTLYLPANAYMVDMQGDYIYYIDLDQKYSLVRVNTTTMIPELLVDGRDGKCISYNIYGDTLFYHVEGDTPALYRMNVNGDNRQFIKYGNITNISCTSQYTFFQIFGVTSLYRIPTTGATDVELINIQ
ncbi:MAG: DUF5050 domain-containing protein [Lachnospiraceae bacterium]